MDLEKNSEQNSHDHGFVDVNLPCLLEVLALDRGGYTTAHSSRFRQIISSKRSFSMDISDGNVCLRVRSCPSNQ